MKRFRSCNLHAKNAELGTRFSLVYDTRTHFLSSESTFPHHTGKDEGPKRGDDTMQMLVPEECDAPGLIKRQILNYSNKMQEVRVSGGVCASEVGEQEASEEET